MIALFVSENQLLMLFYCSISRFQPIDKILNFWTFAKNLQIPESLFWLVSQSNGQDEPYMMEVTLD